MLCLRLVFVVVIVVASVQGQKDVYPRVYDIKGDGFELMHAFLNITNFSYLRNKETYSDKVPIIIEWTGEKPKDVFLSFVFKYSAKMVNNPLQVLIAAEGQEGHPLNPFSCDGIFIIENAIEGKKPFELEFKGLNFTVENPRSPTFDLLRQTVIMNPKNGWYDRSRDQFKMQVKVTNFFH